MILNSWSKGIDTTSSEPVPSDSSGTSRFYQDRSPPYPSFPGIGLPLRLHPAAVTTGREGSLMLPRQTRRLVAHSSTAKKADASFKISFARRSSRFSARSFPHFCRFHTRRPRPSARVRFRLLTQLCTVWADPIPTSEACSERTSSTSRTARSCSSFG